MYIRNKWATVCYRLLTVAVCGLGLFRQLAGAKTLEPLVYFTTQSNMLAFCLFVWKLMPGGRTSRFYALTMGSVTMAMAITSLVFFVLLAPLYTQAMGLTSRITHGLVPVLCMLDWAVFEPKGQLRPLDPLWYMLYPCVYVGFVFLRAVGGSVLSYGSRYPYFFLDPGQLGWGVLVYIAGMLAVFILLGVLWQRLDWFLFGRATYRFGDRHLPNQKG